MLEDLFYRRENVTDVDAAVVGVSRLRWKALSPGEASEERAREVMEHHRFDVLPVAEGDEPVRHYFRTRDWGDYSSVVRETVEYEDVIPQQTPLRSVIRDFAEGDRLFYFLAHENRITGLISVVNLNCRQARIFLFSLLSELEVRMSQVVQSEIDRDNLTEAEVLKIAKEDVQGRYAADKDQRVERNAVEYLYLTDLCKIIRKQELQGVLGFGSKKQFKTAFGRLPDLRNDVAHPSKSLVRSANTAGKLWDSVKVIERALFHLRQWAPLVA